MGITQKGQIFTLNMESGEKPAGHTKLVFREMNSPSQWDQEIKEFIILQPVKMT